jgi:hypothetical protein
VFGCFGFFRYNISEMQLWVFYFAKTSRYFSAPKWAQKYSVQVEMTLDALVTHFREKSPMEGKLLIPVVIDKTNLRDADR